MNKIISSAKWLALLGMLSVLALSIGHTAQASRPLVGTGVAALLGVDEGGLLSNNDAALALAVSSGAYWTRTEVNWSEIESTQGVYNFASTDGPLNKLLNSGMTLVVYVSSNPAWASTLPCAPIDTTDTALVTAFENFMHALAAHYPTIKIWALYNEPENPNGTANSNSSGCFGSTSSGGINDNGVKDSDEYAIMLKAAWKGVHTANPNAILATGALAFDNFNQATAPGDYPGGGNGGTFNYHFVSNLFGYMGANLLSGGDKYMDMVLFNYYEVYGPYWEKKAKGHGIQAKANVLRSRMEQATIPVVDLFVTETGEESRDAWVGLQGQARCMNIIMVRGAAAQLKGIVWWTFKDYPDSAPYPQNTWKYGMVDQNLQLKPSYTAMQTLVAELNTFTYNKTYSNKTGFKDVEAYRFKSGGVTKYAVWSSSRKTVAGEEYKPDCSWTRNKRMVTFKANSIRTVDYLGVTKTIMDNKKGDKDPAVGQVAFKIGTEPKIVQINP